MSNSEIELTDKIIGGLVNEAGKQALRIGNTLIDTLADYFVGKIQNIDVDELMNKLRELLGKLNKDDMETLKSLWSARLVEKGLISSAYFGLSDGHIIDNLHQEGYLSGLYVGYALAMMSLTNNNAPEELIVSVRDDLRSHLTGHHFNNQDHPLSQYQDEKYSWIERFSESNCC